jgi:hypothetical protein
MTRSTLVVQLAAALRRIQLTEVVARKLTRRCNRRAATPVGACHRVGERRPAAERQVVSQAATGGKHG